MISPEHDPRDVTRILFQDFPVWMTLVFYVAAVVAIAAFVYGVYMQVRKYRRGVRSGAWSPFWPRFARMVETVLSHRTIKRRARRAGSAHALIFFGFVLLFIGTSIITLEYDIIEPLTGLKFWYGSFYLIFSLVLDIAGVGLIAGLLYMMYRRKWLALPKLDYRRPDRAPDEPDYDRASYRREDWAFLWTLILIAATGFLLEASRLVWLQGDPTVWDYRWWSPVGTVTASILQGIGIGPEGGAGFRMGLWWTHGLLALAFIGLVPYTKVQHIFTAMGALMAVDPDAKRRLPTADVDQDKIGFSELADFSDKYLLNFDACTKCGRCHEACPANASGFPLSPRDMVLSLRELANDTLSGARMPADPIQVIGDGINQIRPETLWSCRTCGACTEICPVGIEHLPMIVQMRRALIEEGEFDPMLQTTLKSLQKSGNSLGESRRKRPRWTKSLDFTIKDARAEPVDVLWYVGDYASFDPRSQKVTLAFARILHAAGVDFGILYEDEQTAGNDVRRVGEEGLFQALAEANIALLKECAFTSIVTTDPHTFNTIKNEYPEFGGTYRIEHASAMLERLIREGAVATPKTLPYRVTYHDPCHLGRLNDGAEPPRQVLSKLGVDLVEMRRSKDNSFCCGAGGGRIWLPDPPELKKPAELRAAEAAEIDGLEILVVNCPKCLNMMEDGVKGTGNESNFRVMELIELVAEAMADDASGADLAQQEPVGQA
ncbi:heterodisulfide reductase-related iron-sulfur binding cluster [Aurantimonas sp. A3-2-R12]|uniref:heterodisulfide reductase-related iron-sulfur binding cluster n=1 Tax=Aurantimonas sp. A3-2-R12 TaxID=3114362 RepID=UPI002E196EDF|nr:heterodisulfide reductase-related iron-sulfur binding cluster [Aurantimonas sp. A3-2-R12]